MTAYLLKMYLVVNIGFRLIEGKVWYFTVCGFSYLIKTGIRYLVYKKLRWKTNAESTHQIL